MHKLEALKEHREQLREISRLTQERLRLVNKLIEDELRIQGLLFTLEVDNCCVGLEYEYFETLEEAKAMAKVYEDNESSDRHVIYAWIVRNGKGEVVARSE